VRVSLNELVAYGDVDPGAGARISQTSNLVSNYGADLNTAIAAVYGNGSTTIIAPTQSLSFSVNTVTGLGGVNGQITQAAPQFDGYTEPRNWVWAENYGLGDAKILAGPIGSSSSSQSNGRIINSIVSGGGLGSQSSPAAITQTSAVNDFRSIEANAAEAFSWASLVGGGNGAAAISGMAQSAILMTNAVSGAAGLYGNIAQQSGGTQSQLTNRQTAASSIDVGAINPLSPFFSVGNGGSSLTNASQSLSQTLNTLSVPSAVSGSVNQLSAGRNALTSNNMLVSVSASGGSVLSGIQSASNVINGMFR